MTTRTLRIAECSCSHLTETFNSYENACLELLYRLMSVLVELSCVSSGSLALSSSGMIRLARTLPSSTPHWSNELIFQMVPWTKTLCSYSAMSLPSFSGVSRSARIELVGRLPSKVRCRTRNVGTPSAATSSAVLPNACASV